MGERPITALIVRIDAAEPLVGELRRRHDPGALQGLPPHVTVLAPFAPPSRVDAPLLERLGRTLATVAPFDVRLATIGRWPDVCYLAPEPPAPFEQLTRAVWAAFPEWPPYEGRFAAIVPHLTVAWGTTAEVLDCERALAARLATHGPVRAHCREVELVGNTTGRWRTLARWPLDGLRDPAAARPCT